MISVDTNIVVTLLVRIDDPGYGAVARLFAEDMIFVPPTVLLEAEWVIRAGYKWPKADVLRGLSSLLSLPNLETEAWVQSALEYAAAGLDFADAMHLAACGEVEAFVTFDRDLVRKAGDLDGAPDARAPYPTDV